MQDDVRSLVEAYYRLVDDQAFDEMLELFADDAVYARPGYEPLHGKPAIADFYRGARVIVSGRHTLATVLIEGDRAAVEGSMRGTLRDGRDVDVRFADFFSVRDGRFVTRDTYFFAASV